MKKNYETGVKAGYIEYKMPVAMAEAFLKGKKYSNANDYLCKIVNDEFGLKGYCIRVITF